MQIKDAQHSLIKENMNNILVLWVTIKSTNNILRWGGEWYCWRVAYIWKECQSCQSSRWQFSVWQRSLCSGVWRQALFTYVLWPSVASDVFLTCSYSMGRLILFGIPSYKLLRWLDQWKLLDAYLLTLSKACQF